MPLRWVLGHLVVVLLDYRAMHGGAPKSRRLLLRPTAESIRHDMSSQALKLAAALRNTAQRKVIPGPGDTESNIEGFVSCAIAGMESSVLLSTYPVLNLDLTERTQGDEMRVWAPPSVAAAVMAQSLRTEMPGLEGQAPQGMFFPALEVPAAGCQVPGAYAAQRADPAPCQSTASSRAGGVAKSKAQATSTPPPQQPLPSSRPLPQAAPPTRAVDASSARARAEALARAERLASVAKQQHEFLTLWDD